MEKKLLELIEREHKEIANFLQEAFVPYCRDRYVFKVDLDLFFDIARGNFGASQDKIAAEYYDAICKKAFNKTISQSKISRDIASLNIKLKIFCKDKRIIPAIQIYNQYLSPSESREHVGFFFACAKRTDNNTAQNTVPLKMACKKLKMPLHIAEKQKYFHDMREILRCNDSPRWFRKSGPVAVDFEAGHVYERKEYLENLDELITENNFLVLEGDAGSGKSVIVRQYAYNLIKKQPQLPIHFYTFKDDVQIRDYLEFREIVSNLAGTIIIEDIHLATQDICALLRNLQRNDERIILLTTRRPSEDGDRKCSGTMFYKSLELPSRLNISLENKEFDEIIDHFKSKQKINLSSSQKDLMREKCEGNLWLLSYALMGNYDKKGDGSPEEWINTGIKEDFESLKRVGCSPEVLLSLSPLYMYEVPTANEYLTEELKISPKDIKLLLDRHEIEIIIENHKVYYRLPHSTLAKAYWDFRDDITSAFLNRLEKKPFKEDSLNYIYHYATYRDRDGSGLANGLTAILKMDYPTRTLILQQLDVDRETINTVMSDKNVESFYEWLQAYGFYFTFTQNPKDNIVVKLIKPFITQEQVEKLEVINFDVIKKARILFAESDNKEQLRTSIQRISEEQSIGPDEVCQILKFLSYVDRSVMKDFWISEGQSVLCDQIMSLNIYNISQITTLLFWIEKSYGLAIWNRIERELKTRLRDIKNDTQIPKAIGLLRLYLPKEILSAYLAMFNMDDIISKISLLNEGFCRDYYITSFSLFDDEYKGRLEKLFNANNFVKNMPQADLIELSICIKYLFTTYSQYVGVLDLVDYDTMVNRFDNEPCLDGVLRVIEAIYKVSPETGTKLCWKLNITTMSEKLKNNAFRYKTKEQFIAFLSYVDPEIGNAIRQALLSV